MKKLNWYAFTQNNSGGVFDVDDKVCGKVFIEAEDIDDACTKAQELGIYFDGVELDLDCSCCGDRWYVPYEALNFPEKNYAGGEDFVDVISYAQSTVNQYSPTTPGARIYYDNGEIKEICKTTKSENK
jgi:hypothetical protein